MGRPGLEPGASRLKAEYSTIELATLEGICLTGTEIYTNINRHFNKTKFNLNVLTVRVDPYLVVHGGGILQCEPQVLR